MIDGIRISSSSNEKLLSSLKESKYRTDIIMNKKLHNDLDTGYKFFNVDGLDFRIGRIRNHIKGSIHKWYNTQMQNGEQNYNDFTFSQIVDAIDRLTSIIGSDSFKIERLEFGFNIDVDLNLKNVITNNILFFRKHSQSQLETFGGKGLLKRFKTSKYDFKIYDKGLQYVLCNGGLSRLRIEVVYKTSSELKRLNIYSLHDLKKKSLLRALFLDFNKKLEHLIIVDDFNSGLSKSQKNLLYIYTNPIYWKVNFLNTSGTYKHRKFREFKILISELKLDSIKDVLLSKLMEKYVYLINN